MSWRTNRDGRHFKMDEVFPKNVLDGRPLFDELRKYIPEVTDTLALLLVKDGLKPSGWAEATHPKLLPLLNALGIKYKKYGGRLYFARDKKNLQRVINADYFGHGGAGQALGFPISATQFFESDRNEAQNRAEARFPYPEGKWFDEKSPTEKKAYNEARTKAYDEELAPFQQDPNSVFFVYGKNDRTARTFEQRWKNHLTEKYGVKF